MGAATQPTQLVNDLFGASRERLFRYAMSLCGQIDRAEDLVQEAFLRALQHAHTLASLRDAQRHAWLKSVVRNRYFDEERAHKRARAMLTELLREARRPTGTEHLPELDRILEQVPDKYRTVLEKRYRLGMNSTEIGKELGIPPATVRSHLHQAIRCLRDRTSSSAP